MAIRSTYMNRQRKAELKVETDRHYAQQGMEHDGKQGSTGWKQVLCERNVRDMVLAKGITTSGSMYKRGVNKDDILVQDKDGNWIHIEVKHGAGALAYACTLGIKEFTSRERDMCLQDVDWVIYRLEADPELRRTKMALEYRVCTREDFLDMLEEYCHGPKAAGFQTATKLSRENKQINIQSQYVKKFWEGLQDDPRAMTLWDWSFEVLGRDLRWDW